MQRFLPRFLRRGAPVPAKRFVPTIMTKLRTLQGRRTPLLSFSEEYVSETQSKLYVKGFTRLSGEELRKIRTFSENIMIANVNLEKGTLVILIDTKSDTTFNSQFVGGVRTEDAEKRRNMFISTVYSVIIKNGESAEDKRSRVKSLRDVVTDWSAHVFPSKDTVHMSFRDNPFGYAISIMGLQNFSDLDVKFCDEHFEKINMGISLSIPDKVVSLTIRRNKEAQMKMAEAEADAEVEIVGTLAKRSRTETPGSTLVNVRSNGSTYENNLSSRKRPRSDS